MQAIIFWRKSGWVMFNFLAIELATSLLNIKSVPDQIKIKGVRCQVSGFVRRQMTEVR
jgi:hypothetical protein